jgi:hypothetical protein
MTIEKPDIYLIAGFNKAYLQKSMTYLETMNCFSSVNNIVITLDFDIASTLREKLNNIKFIRINSGQIQSPNPNTCMQHGAFLEVVDFINDDSIIIFTDTDITIQRPFNESELQLLRDCKDGDVFVNLNMSEEQTLLKDTEISPPNIDVSELTKKYPEIATFKSYNTGVICANCRTYKRIYQQYNQYWPAFSPLFDGHVKQQFLLTYIIQKHFHLRLLPYVIHSQAHSIPVDKYSDKRRRPGYMGETEPTAFKLCIDSEVVVFNHHIKHESVLKINHLQKKIGGLYKIVAILILLVIAILIIALT